MASLLVLTALQDYSLYSSKLGISWWSAPLLGDDGRSVYLLCVEGTLFGLLFWETVGALVIWRVS